MSARFDASNCSTPAWLPEGHGQTIFAALCATHHTVSFTRERVDTPDGDFIDIDWTYPGAHVEAGRHAKDPITIEAVRHQPAIVLFHGLEGSSQSPYAQAVAHYFRARGWVVAIPHFRGCSGTPNRLPRAYHSGDSDDIEFMLQTVRQRLPQGRWHAAGVSLGGNALAKYLGERAESADWLHAGAVISAPLDLTASGHTLSSGLINRHLYTRMFMRSLRNKVLSKARRFPAVIDVLRVAHAQDLHEFDDAYTAPLHGFSGVADYWARASGLPWLRAITVPTLVLNARNDPFLPARYLPGPEVASRHILLHQPADGGHAGFASGRFPCGLNWLPQRLERFFTQGL